MQHLTRYFLNPGLESHQDAPAHSDVLYLESDDTQLGFEDHEMKVVMQDIATLESHQRVLSHLVKKRQSVSAETMDIIVASLESFQARYAGDTDIPSMESLGSTFRTINDGYRALKAVEEVGGRAMKRLAELLRRLWNWFKKTLGSLRLKFKARKKKAEDVTEDLKKEKSERRSGNTTSSDSATSGSTAKPMQRADVAVSLKGVDRLFWRDSFIAFDTKTTVQQVTSGLDWFENKKLPEIKKLGDALYREFIERAGNDEIQPKDVYEIFSEMVVSFAKASNDPLLNKAFDGQTVTSHVRLPGGYILLTAEGKTSYASVNRASDIQFKTVFMKHPDNHESTKHQDHDVRQGDIPTVAGLIQNAADLQEIFSKVEKVFAAGDRAEADFSAFINKISKLEVTAQNGMRIWIPLYVSYVESVVTAYQKYTEYASQLVSQHMAVYERCKRYADI